MESTYNTFKNWDDIDCEGYLFDKDIERQIDDPGLNQDDASRKSQQEFDDSDDFHKYDDTDEDASETDDEVSNSGKYDGNIGI
ncbi:hypothetical protein HYN49_11350 [Flavobacterium pallidum]|uniref:Uncharacterized protein n=2 Tax=Flavobacterium pallidum TaxID=2172098 RepID=A0A2S1SJC7_9FLAO|nr:hypothetical protein HYN49_11350 [Flavobacterium pallidum]